MLQSTDGVKEFFVLCQADTLNVGLAFLSVSSEAMDQCRRSVRMGCIFEYRNELIDKVGVGGRKNDLFGWTAASVTGS